MTETRNDEIRPRGAPARPVVTLETTLGAIEVELWPDKAPVTVRNFLKYLDDGFYDGTIFHRVIEGFMIQAGGFTPGMVRKPTRPPIANEAGPALENDRGTVGMARTSAPHSATSQFFINTVDNRFLNPEDPDGDGVGYCVFGRVIAGLDVVDRIAAVKTGRSGSHSDVPVEPVIVQRARRATT